MPLGGHSRESVWDPSSSPFGVVVRMTGFVDHSCHSRSLHGMTELGESGTARLKPFEPTEDAEGTEEKCVASQVSAKRRREPGAPGLNGLPG